ncbi:hypothetical protein LEMLEM_LOCUS18738 [Lemmus lemmus]
MNNFEFQLVGMRSHQGKKHHGMVHHQKSLKAVIQSRNLESRTDEETTKNLCFWLVSPGLLSFLSYTTQVHCLRMELHKELGLHTSVSH